MTITVSCIEKIYLTIDKNKKKIIRKHFATFNANNKTTEDQNVQANFIKRIP